MCLEASGVFVALTLHVEVGTIIAESIRAEHFGILQLWEFFWQPVGEREFSKKTDPKRTSKSLKNLKSFLK